MRNWERQRGGGAARPGQVPEVARTAADRSGQSTKSPRCSPPLARLVRNSPVLQGALAAFRPSTLPARHVVRREPLARFPELHRDRSSAPETERLIRTSLVVLPGRPDEPEHVGQNGDEDDGLQEQPQVHRCRTSKHLFRSARAPGFWYGVDLDLPAPGRGGRATRGRRAW